MKRTGPCITRIRINRGGRADHPGDGVARGSGRLATDGPAPSDPVAELPLSNNFNTMFSAKIVPNIFPFFFGLLLFYLIYLFFCRG